MSGLTPGAQDLLVATDRGTVTVPFVTAVPIVDVEGGVVVIDAPPGLLMMTQSRSAAVPLSSCVSIDPLSSPTTSRPSLLMGKAEQTGLVDLHAHDLRNWATGNIAASTIPVWRWCRHGDARGRGPRAGQGTLRPASGASRRRGPTRRGSVSSRPSLHEAPLSQGRGGPRTPTRSSSPLREGHRCARRWALPNAGGWGCRVSVVTTSPQQQ